METKFINKPKLIIMVGLPGSGKSTFAQTLKSTDTFIFSSDYIRKQLYGDEQNQTNPQLVFSTLYKKARNKLKQGFNAVIDATNISSFDRKRALKHFSNLDVIRIAIVITTSSDTCIKRDLSRQRTVGEDVIKKFEDRFQPPTHEEGFDEIQIIDNNGQKFIKKKTIPCN